MRHCISEPEVIMNEFLRQGQSTTSTTSRVEVKQTSWLDPVTVGKVGFKRLHRLPIGRPPFGVTAMPLLQALGPGLFWQDENGCFFFSPGNLK